MKCWSTSGRVDESLPGGDAYLTSANQQEGEEAYRQTRVSIDSSPIEKKEQWILTH